MINSTFQVFSPRWGHEDDYSVKLTTDAFEISLNTKGAKCEIDENNTAVWTGHDHGTSNPMLNIMSDDFIYAPSVVPEAIEWLLGQYRNGSVSDAAAEEALAELFSWIDQTARAKPTNSVWSSYFG